MGKKNTGIPGIYIIRSTYIDYHIIIRGCRFYDMYGILYQPPNKERGVLYQPTIYKSYRRVPGIIIKVIWWSPTACCPHFFTSKYSECYLFIPEGAIIIPGTKNKNSNNSPVVRTYVSLVYREQQHTSSTTMMIQQQLYTHTCVYVVSSSPFPRYRYRGNTSIMCAKSRKNTNMEEARRGYESWTCQFFFFFALVYSSSRICCVAAADRAGPLSLSTEHRTQPYKHFRGPKRLGPWTYSATTTFRGPGDPPLGGARRL